MAELPQHHPEVYARFMVQRSEKKFSLMGLYQSQLHSIKLLKEGNGPKGLYGQAEDKAVIELSRAEVLRVIDELECASTHTHTQHNWRVLNTQKAPHLSSKVSQLTQLSSGSCGPRNRILEKVLIPREQRFASIPESQ